MAKINRHELRAYLKPLEYKKVEKESVARGISVSRTVRNCLMEYMQLKEELAETLSAPGNLGEAHTGKIIHSLLARTEERIGATIQGVEERISSLFDQMLVLTAMIDRMYMGVMQHLPELPPELNEAAIASSKRRHEKWLKSTENLVTTGEIPSGFTSIIK